MDAACRLWRRFEVVDGGGPGMAVITASAYMEQMRRDGWSSVAVELAPHRVVVHSCIKQEPS